jgi:hypothetical protein
VLLTAASAVLVYALGVLWAARAIGPWVQSGDDSHSGKSLYEQKAHHYHAKWGTLGKKDVDEWEAAAERLNGVDRDGRCSTAVWAMLFWPVYAALKAGRVVLVFATFHLERGFKAFSRLPLKMLPRPKVADEDAPVTNGSYRGEDAS